MTEGRGAIENDRGEGAIENDRGEGAIENDRGEGVRRRMMAKGEGGGVSSGGGWSDLTPFAEGPICAGFPCARVGAWDRSTDNPELLFRCY